MIFKIDSMLFKKFFISFILIFCSTSLFSQCFKSADKAILTNLKYQQDCWNKGDIKSYMSVYWNSDSLKFIGKSGITYGWKETLAHYEKSYPDKATMGQLAFSEITIIKLNRKTAYCIGKWYLTRKVDSVGGYFSLIWNRIHGKWVIVIDHTS